MSRPEKLPFRFMGKKGKNGFSAIWNKFLERFTKHIDNATDIFMKNNTSLNKSGNKMDKVMLICRSML